VFCPAISWGLLFVPVHAFSVSKFCSSFILTLEFPTFLPPGGLISLIYSILFFDLCSRFFCFRYATVTLHFLRAPVTSPALPFCKNFRDTTCISATGFTAAVPAPATLLELLQNLPATTCGLLAFGGTATGSATGLHHAITVRPTYLCCVDPFTFDAFINAIFLHSWTISVLSAFSAFCSRLWMEPRFLVFYHSSFSDTYAGREVISDVHYACSHFYWYLHWNSYYHLHFLHLPSRVGSAPAISCFISILRLHSTPASPAFSGTLRSSFVSFMLPWCSWSVYLLMRISILYLFTRRFLDFSRFTCFSWVPVLGLPLLLPLHGDSTCSCTSPSVTILKDYFSYYLLACSHHAELAYLGLIATMPSAKNTTATGFQQLVRSAIAAAPRLRSASRYNNVTANI